MIAELWRAIVARWKGATRNFRSDWQYVIAASRINSALSLVTLFSVLAILTKVTDLMNLGVWALYSLVGSTITYLAALLLIKLRAPAFLQEYADYKAYDDKKHSHRWALWEFYFNLTKLKNGFSLLQESIEKQLSLKATDSALDKLRVKPNFSGEHIAGTMKLPSSSGVAPMTVTAQVFPPINFKRDLYMAFTITKNQTVERYVLPIREGDATRDNKCKELFWIVFSEAAKENRFSKWLATNLIRLSVLLLFAAFGFAIYHSLTKTTSPTPCDFHFI